MLSYCTRIAARPPSQPDSRRSAVTITHGLNDEFPLQGCSRSDVACCGREVPTKARKGKHVRIGSRQSQAKIRGLGLLRIRGRQITKSTNPKSTNPHDGAGGGKRWQRRGLRWQRRRSAPSKNSRKGSHIAWARCRTRRRTEEESKRHHGSTEQQNTTVHVPTNPTGIPHRVRL